MKNLFEMSLLELGTHGSTLSVELMSLERTLDTLKSIQQSKVREIKMVNQLLIAEGVSPITHD